MMSRLIKLYKNNILVAVLLMSFTGCDFITGIVTSDDRMVVAKCFGEKLYIEDIAAIIPEHLSKEDSSMRASAFIQKWIHQTTLVHYANEDTLLDRHKIERQVEDFRNQLIAHSYQKALIKQHLDTTIEQKEIQEYYTKNKKQYRLKNTAVKAIYLNIYRKQPSLSEVEKWLNSNQRALSQE